MQRVRPLHDTHPQFSTFKCPTYHEFRVENWKPATDGSGKIIRSHPEVKLAVWVALLASWIYHFTGTLQLLGVVIGAWFLIQQVLLGVTYESLVVFPSHGIQLETHRGFKHHVLSSSRTFIPFTILQDVVINEALYGWNVRYYIVSLTQPKGDTTILKIVFPSLLPHFPILKAIYTDLQVYLPKTCGIESSVP